MRWLTMVLAGGLMLGCGDSDSDDDDDEGTTADTLDCAWLEGDNCWKAILTSARSCLPAEADTGVLSADGSTCTYASGHGVTFEEPLVLPLPDDDSYSFRFTITANGQQCLSYRETEVSLTVTVGDQTFEQRPSGRLGIEFVCPDGSSYTNDNAFDLLECRGDFLASLEIIPGYSYASNDTGVSFGLLGYEEAFPLFDCQLPP